MPTTTHPPGCYYVNASTGTIQRQCNPLLAIALGQVGFTGEHGNPAGLDQPFSTFDDAKAWVDKNRGNTIGGQLAQHDLAPHIPSPLTGINAVGDFFSRLDEANTWKRVGEFLAGVVLLWIGLQALTRDTAVGTSVRQATNAAKKVVK